MELTKKEMQLMQGADEDAPPGHLATTKLAYALAAEKSAGKVDIQDILFHLPAPAMVALGAFLTACGHGVETDEWAMGHRPDLFPKEEGCREEVTP